VPEAVTADPAGMSTTTIVIVLDLDDAADCPSGSAAVAGGEAREFHGWLGLAAAIKALASGSLSTSTPLTEGEQA
jgi:hypothetical protein